MKKVLIALIVLIVILIAGFAFFNSSHINVEEAYLAMGFDDFTAQWGYPAKSHGGTIFVWQFDAGVFVGAFEHGTQGKLTDYAQFDADRRLISGTISPYKSSRFLRLQALLCPYLHSKIYDVGSGVYLYGTITSDGYILIWPEGFLGALDAYSSDCFSPEY